MRILTYTSLFPNREQPNSAIFIKNRMAAVNKYTRAEIRVVAPAPWFPKSMPGYGHWKKFARIPFREQSDGLLVYHPRYLVTPKVGMALYGYSMFMGSLKAVKRIYNEWPFDLIDAHYIYPDGFAALLLGNVLNVPVVVSARGTDMNLYPRFGLIRPFIRRVIARSDRLISVCQSLADLMVDHGAELHRVTVIPNGVDPAYFKKFDRIEARQRLQLVKNAKILLSVGGLIERKGHHILIEALSQMKNDQSIDFLTYIVGLGPDFKQLQRQINQAGLTDIVKLVGEVDNNRLPEWYCAADLFFLGSSREGWPNVISEALACGTPVVATAVNGIPEIIINDNFGLVVARTPQAFAGGILRGFQKKWDREQISLYGRQRTWNVVASEVYSVFHDMLSDDAVAVRNG